MQFWDSAAIQKSDIQRYVLFSLNTKQLILISASCFKKSVKTLKMCKKSRVFKSVNMRKEK